MQAKESLGKTVSIRKQPRVTGDYVGAILPHATIDYIGIVKDEDYPNDPDRLWFDLDGKYCAYKYPPNGIRFILLTDILKLNLYRVKHGTERPIDDPLPANKGSFDISPFYIKPARIKGDPLKIPLGLWNWIAKKSNAYVTSEWSLSQKQNWLIGPNYNDTMYMANDEFGNYRIPSLGVSGGAIINILNTENNFGQVQIWPINQPIPNILPVYLYYLWYQIVPDKPSLVRDGIVCPIIGLPNIDYWLPLEWLIKV